MNQAASQSARPGPVGRCPLITPTVSGPVSSPTGAARNDGFDPGKAGRRRRFVVAAAPAAIEPASRSESCSMTTETRAVVTWKGPGQPIVLTVRGPDGETRVPLLPKRALTLAQELLTRGVQAIKADWPG